MKYATVSIAMLITSRSRTEKENLGERIVTSSFDVFILYVFAVSSDRDRTQATTRVPRVPL